MWRRTTVINGVPAWPTSAYSETAPFCAIAVDAFTSPTTGNPIPPVAYPNVSFPTFLGKGIAQYNKPASSDFAVSDCTIRGFEAGIVITPSGGNSQGDFNRISRCWIAFCTYAISVSHTDSRENSVSDCYISSCHTAITTAAHGIKLGNWGGAIVNTAFDRNIQIFDFSDPAYPRTGPIKFVSCYGENLWRLGNFGSGAGSLKDTQNEFDHCTFKFIQDKKLGIPANVLSTTTHTYVTFNGGVFSNYLGAFMIVGDVGHTNFINGAVFEDGTLRQKEYDRHIAKGDRRFGII